MISPEVKKVGGHRHCGSGDVTLLEVEVQDSNACFNPPILFISKAHGMSSSHT